MKAVSSEGVRAVFLRWVLVAAWIRHTGRIRDLSFKCLTFTLLYSDDVWPPLARQDSQVVS
jgi:hypothetical protein